MRGRLLPTRPREGADGGALEPTHWYQNASVALGGYGAWLVAGLQMRYPLTETSPLQGSGQRAAAC